MSASSTPATRRLQGFLAVAIRDHGPDSQEAHEARLAFYTTKLATQLAQLSNEHGPFREQDRAAILAALDGNEVRVSA